MFTLAQTIVAIKQYQAKSRLQRFESLVGAVNFRNVLSPVQIQSLSQTVDNIYGRFSPGLSGAAPGTKQCITTPCN